MIKKLLFALLSIGSMSQMRAQCTVVPSCSVGTSGYCTSPAEYTNLPNGTAAAPYNTTIQVSLGDLGGALISASLTSVSGLPAGLSYSSNPSNGLFMANSNACVLISGNLANLSAGNYTISLNVDVNTLGGVQTQSLPWYLTIDPATTTCSIVPSCSIGISGYCTSPVENTNLPNGTELSAYNSVIQIAVGSSSGFIGANITSISGLPAGLTYYANPANGVMPAGSNACVIVTGTPSAGSAGTYTMSLIVDVVLTTGTSQQTLIWYLTIDPSGVTSIRSNDAPVMFISPNPVVSHLFVSSVSHFGKTQIIDALGKVVISHDANYSTQTSIDVSSLSKGVYFIQINDGTKLMTKKFIKE